MSNITEDELTEAINILKSFAKDQLINHLPDLDDKLFDGSNKNIEGWYHMAVVGAMKYIDKAMADDDLVMVYYP